MFGWRRSDNKTVSTPTTPKRLPPSAGWRGEEGYSLPQRETPGTVGKRPDSLFGAHSRSTLCPFFLTSPLLDFVNLLTAKQMERVLAVEPPSRLGWFRSRRRVGPKVSRWVTVGWGLFHEIFTLEIRLQQNNNNVVGTDVPTPVDCYESFLVQSRD